MTGVQTCALPIFTMIKGVGVCSSALRIVCVCFPAVCEVVQTLQLCSDRDPRDGVGDLSVCLDGMQVDAETFASAERERGEQRCSVFSVSDTLALPHCHRGEGVIDALSCRAPPAAAVPNGDVRQNGDCGNR